MEELSELESKILFCICRRNVSIDLYSSEPVSVKRLKKYIESAPGLQQSSMYSIKKAVKKLKELDLICYTSSGGQTEDGVVYCNNGYCVTKKAYQTKECRQAWEEERRICKECFSIDIGTIEDHVKRMQNIQC